MIYKKRGERVDSERLTSALPARLRESVTARLAEIYELRIYSGGAASAVTKNGIQRLGAVGETEFSQLFSRLCGGAPYAYEEELKRGFLTLGGCRIGVCGTAVAEGGGIAGVKDVRSLNIRFAREIKGAAAPLFARLGGNVRGGLLLAGPPACGKTTLLRDLARLLSESGRKVCVIDERGELAAVSGGLPAVDVGPLTDVLDGYPKTKAAEIALRCLSPDVIVCDEVGEGEADALIECADCGVDVVAAVHGNERSRRFKALAESGCFRRAALFKPDAVGVIERVIDIADF